MKVTRAVAERVADVLVAKYEGWGGNYGRPTVIPPQPTFWSLAWPDGPQDWAHNVAPELTHAFPHVDFQYGREGVLNLFDTEWLARTPLSAQELLQKAYDNGLWVVVRDGESQVFDVPEGTKLAELRWDNPQAHGTGTRAFLTAADGKLLRQPYSHVARAFDEQK